MAIELSLTKADVATPWGFRLAGGADCGAPLVVVQVKDGSRAQDGGLGVEDQVVRINDIPTAGLSGRETHDLIRASGNLLTVAVRRGDDRYFSQGYTGDNSREQEVGDEVLQILEGAREVLEKKRSDFELTNHPEQLSTETEMTVHSRQETSQQNVQSISKSTESMLNQSSSQGSPCTFPNVEGRKWSTFLQKPDVAIPKFKSKEPERVIEGEPYRVRITKQPKKRAQLYSDPIEPLESEQAADANNDEIVEEKQEESQEEQHEISSYTETEENAEEFNENEKNNNGELEITCNIDENDNAEETAEERELTPEKELTLEERLAQVQRQLEALSQLPSDLQDTLSALTQELKQIVGPTAEEESKRESERHVTFRIDEEGSVVSEGEHRSRASSEEPIDEDSLEVAANDLEDRVNSQDDCAAPLDEPLDDELAVPEETEEDIRAKEEEEELLRAQAEAERLERERLEKIEKEEEPRAPPKPYLRPIILPGGRKWSEAEDASPQAKSTKMSDEKIASTIEQYSEVNQWNKSWPWADEEKPVYRINFLKYTPPPKNLDYLQRSEVYRLVHDMEPPVRGISTRSGVVLAEEDYYEKEPSAALHVEQLSKRQTRATTATTCCINQGTVSRTPNLCHNNTRARVNNK